MKTGSSMDKIILKHYLARLADMAYDIEKSWIPNKNLEKVVPHLRKACKYIKDELQKLGGG